MKKLAVIILNWNGSELLKKFLPPAIRFTQGPEVDLFVADNGSTDDSLAVLATFPEVKVIRFEQNFGFAEGYNKAIEETSYPYTILLNSDVEVTDGWWQPLLKFMQENPVAGACQPKIRAYNDRSKFEYAGAAGGLLDRLGYPYCRGRVFDSIETDNGQYDNAPAEVAWASGAAMMVDTSLYKELGGLDPLFFAHMEEIDLCCRMRGAGRPSFFVPDSMVFHVGGASLNQGNPRKTYLNFRNNLLLLHKNLPYKRGRKILFMRRLADTLAFGMYLLKGDFPNARAIVKAHNDFRKLRKHYTSSPERDYLRHSPGADRFIVADHYILKKTR